ncbi:MAG: iron ABC transporter permease, partial [bacterium]|nr:iron ABC transporter permease [bacterium]
CAAMNSPMLTPLRWWRIMAAYGALVVIVLCVAPWWGATRLSWGEVWAAWRGGGDVSVWLIFIDQRVPRVLLGLVVGMALGMAGAAFQVILRNPLATPYTLGVASAGALGAAVVLAIPGLAGRLGPLGATQGSALAGSVLAALGIFMLARRLRGVSTNVLLLSGVALNLFCSSALLLVRFVADPQHLVAVDRWLMGGLITVGYSDVAGMLPLIIAGAVVVISQAHGLNQLSFGEEVAGGRGVSVRRVLTMTFFGSVLMTAGAVAVAGPIGFVGLIVPHTVRLMSGPDQRVVLPASALLGGAVLALCDVGARTWLAPTEIPVGIITACVGAPVFLFLLLRRCT